MKIIKRGNREIEGKLEVKKENTETINEYTTFIKNNMKNIFVFIIIIIIGITVFLFYLNFITYKGNLEGEHVLYVKVDGKTGVILKIDNKYLKNQIYIKNSKNFEYGTYLINFDVKKVNVKKRYAILEGRIIGYKGSKLNYIRKYIINTFDRLFITNENIYAFSKASILGEKSDVSRDMKDKFKYTGLAHLIVISGTHISLVIMGIVKLFDRISLVGYRLKYILALIILTLYCMIIGMSPGIMRAYIMGAMMILARIFFENEDSKKSVLVSFIIIVILNPYSIFDISMQLSYAAVIAIVFIYPIVDEILEKKFFYKIENEIIKNTLKMIILSFIIQITSVPLFLYYFEKLPIFSFVINVVGVPVGTLLIKFLFVITLLNILKIEILNYILIWITEFIYNAFEGFILIGSKIPLLQINLNSKISIIFVVIYYIILMIFLKISSIKIRFMV